MEFAINIVISAIIERRSGEAPALNELTPRMRYEKRNTSNPPRIPAIKPPIDIIPRLMASILGGPRRSSREREVFELLMLFSSLIESIIENNKPCSNGDKYISNIKNCKIF
jgi:hypothetical protein